MVDEGTFQLYFSNHFITVVKVLHEEVQEKWQIRDVEYNLFYFVSFAIFS